jgi:hypothetical protein
MINKKTVGVITGDLIRSSALSSEEKNLVKSELGRFSANSPDVLLPLQFFRGDSFQLLQTLLYHLSQFTSEAALFEHHILRSI